MNDAGRPISLAELAGSIDATVDGDGDVVVRGVRPLLEAGEGQISYLDPERELKSEIPLHATALIVHHDVDRSRFPDGMTLLRVSTKDGLTGYATGLAFDRERESLGEYIGQFLLGLDPYDLDAVEARLSESAYLGWRNAWMDVAFWDIAARVLSLIHI